MESDKQSTDFTFFRSYWETVQDLRQANEEAAHEFLMAICEYAFENRRYDGDNVYLRALLRNVYPIIDKGEIRRRASRENGEKGGAPKKTKKTITDGASDAGYD